MYQFFKLFSELYQNTNRTGKRWIFKIIDTFLIIISIYLAFNLRFDIFNVWSFLPQYQNLILLLLPIKICTFWLVGLYKPVIRYAGLEFLSTAFKGVAGSSGIFIAVIFIFSLPSLPRSIFIIDAFLTLVLIVFSRIMVRWLIINVTERSQIVKSSTENILIYGAGRTGSQVAQLIVQDKNRKLVGFLDDDKQLLKHEISGKTVFSPQKLDALIEKYHIETILLAVQSAGKKRNLEIIKTLQKYSVQIKTIPDINRVVSGEFTVNEIRTVDIADLLGREEVNAIDKLLQKNIYQKTVLVTGAGGSIGSEMCRQIAKLDPKRLILLERNEYALYEIDIELKEHFPDLEIIPFLGSVTIRDLLEKVFSAFQIDTVYHAAAYKHVPLVEANIVEGIYNNVIGTMRCVQAAEKYKVESFVLISTDKAVRPTNVMGTTKRIAELILQAFAQKKGIKTRFAMVRFGNVLDSAGSVVPRFRKQIEDGKDLTVTHKEINRYFMSIPEASRLVIQAGALGKGGDVFLLDMGEPVKIYDLAVQMIELSGFKLGDDIDINITGLRPGEKLYEELLIDKANGQKTIHPKIFTANEHFFQWKELETMIQELRSILKTDNRTEIINQLKTIVPEFEPDLINDKLYSKKIIPFSSQIS
ncbi:MAG: polysaccharide biosynthesis protein [Deltaproteobacteria bacterium]|nr:polysaccharide biosynthesis protein [Deltaproteobacteria bacterium]